MKVSGICFGLAMIVFTGAAFADNSIVIPRSYSADRGNCGSSRAQIENSISIDANHLKSDLGAGWRCRILGNTRGTCDRRGRVTGVVAQFQCSRD